MSAGMSIASKTDTGVRRTENQDAVLVLPVPNGASEGAAHLLAVADGVGGGPGGRLASEQTVRSLGEAMSAQPEGDPSEALRLGFHQANVSVRQIAEEHPELAGMASTLTAAYVQDGRAWLANVGDSRVYLIRESGAYALTYDHSWVAEQVEAGHMTAVQAAADPRRNMITRAIGVDPTLEPDLYEPVDLHDGDVLLLCSDGLYGVVEDEELASLAGGTRPDEAVERLVTLANERGGPDNISVVIGMWTADTPTIRL